MSAAFDAEQLWNMDFLSEAAPCSDETTCHVCQLQSENPICLGIQRDDDKFLLQSENWPRTVEVRVSGNSGVILVLS